MKLIIKFIIMSILAISNGYSQSLIRDAEIEKVIRDISEPIFAAAGISHDNVNIYIVNDSQLNAFVAGGSNIFIHTGLIGLTDDPDMLTGVLAHETGHIAGGHLLKTSEEFKNTALKSTIGYVVGLAAAAIGAPQAGVVIAQGTGHVLQRQLLKHTRTHEEAADQAALTYLDRMQLSSRGLLELLNELYSKEQEIYGDLNPYVLTHPLSRERIIHVKNHLSKSRYANSTHNKEMLKDFSMSVVKLNAFLNPFDATMSQFPLEDNSKQARYARAIAYYKKPDLELSLSQINSLIEEDPDNPFFHELKGQILFENSYVYDSIEHYQKAVDLQGDIPLLKIVLATAQVASEDETMRKRAIKNLKKALLKEPDNKFAWRQIAIAYGRGGDLGMSNLALAEEYALSDKKREVKQYIKTAKKHLDIGSPSYIRATDLINLVEKNKEKK